jgi:hypothetical protein
MTFINQTHKRMTKKICPPFDVKSKTIALLLMLFTIGLRAQSIHFNYTDGTNAFYNLEDVRKITFDADVMNLHLLDGSMYAWNVSTIGHYQYDESSLNVQEWLNIANAWDVMIFPNPTSANLNVCFNLPKEDEITIALFDKQGKLILQKSLGKQVPGEYQEILDLSNIPQGTYVCRISGKQNTITKKIIKN